MAFRIPTLSEVNRTVENGFSQAFYGSSGTLRAMVLKVIAKVFAGAIYLVVLLLAYIWKNEFIDTADVDGLVAKGAKFGLSPKPASRSRGVVFINGTAGTTVPAGTVLVDPNTGNEYEILSDCTISNGPTSATAQVSSLGYGSQYDMNGGVQLEFRDNPPGDFEVITSGFGFRGGSSVDVTVDGVVRQWGESVDDFRKRLKVRAKNQAVGGSVTDYWEWAMSFSEVSDAFVISNWPSTNAVAIYCANFRSEYVYLNPTVVNSIRDYITSDDRRPATSNPIIGPVRSVDVAFTVAIPVVNDFYKEAIIGAITEYFRTVGPGQKFSMDSLRQQILGFGGVEDCAVTEMTVNGNSCEEYTFDKTWSGAQLGGEVANVHDLSSLVSFINLA